MATSKLAELQDTLAESDSEWVNALLDLTKVHNTKGADYGSDEDIYANVTACTELGVPPWVGVSIRMADKEQRIRKHLTGGELVNDSVDDDINDNAVYGIIRKIVFERKPEPVCPLSKDQYADHGRFLDVSKVLMEMGHGEFAVKMIDEYFTPDCEYVPYNAFVDLWEEFHSR